MKTTIVIAGPGCQKTNHATAYWYKLAGNFVVSLTHVFQNKGLNRRGPWRISSDNTNDILWRRVGSGCSEIFLVYSSTPKGMLGPVWAHDASRQFITWWCLTLPVTFGSLSVNCLFQPDGLERKDRRLTLCASAAWHLALDCPSFHGTEIWNVMHEKLGNYCLEFVHHWTRNFEICFLYTAFLIILAESSYSTMHAFFRLFVASYRSKWASSNRIFVRSVWCKTSKPRKFCFKLMASRSVLTAKVGKWTFAGFLFTDREKSNPLKPSAYSVRHQI